MILEVVNSLNAAADLIEEEGWFILSGPRSGSFLGRNPDGACYCAVTALVHVLPSDLSTRSAALWHLCDFVGCDQYNLGFWNDEQENAEVVINAMRNCAKQLSVDS